MDFSIRLEEMLVNLLPVTRVVKNQMLCSRLWAGLRDASFRNFVKFKVDSISDFNQLRKVLRELEVKFNSGRTLYPSGLISSTFCGSSGPSHSVTSVSPVSSATSSVSQAIGSAVGKPVLPSVGQLLGVDIGLVDQLKTLNEQMAKMSTRMDYMEKELKNVRNNHNSGLSKDRPANMSSSARPGSVASSSAKYSKSSKPLNRNPPLSKGL